MIRFHLFLFGKDCVKNAKIFMNSFNNDFTRAFKKYFGLVYISVRERHFSDKTGQKKRHHDDQILENEYIRFNSEIIL